MTLIQVKIDVSHVTNQFKFNRVRGGRPETRSWLDEGAHEKTGTPVTSFTLLRGTLPCNLSQKTKRPGAGWLRQVSDEAVFIAVSY
jgi:hypothetical protein